MATTEPVQQPIEVPGVTIQPSDKGQAEAINSALGGFDPTTATPVANPTAPAGVKTLFDSTSGKTISIVDSQAFGGGKFNLKKLAPGQPVIIDGEGIGKVKGGKGASDDTIISGSNDDMVFNVGDGNDKVVSTGFGDSSFDMGDGNDSAYGGAGDDTIDGGTGNDFLSGGAGSDSITGGAGDDTIEGGRGNDKLAGGGGHDTFIFGNQPTGSDTINNFTADDVLKIADRNGDGHLTADVTNADGSVTKGDYYLATNDDGDAIIWLRNEDGVVDGKIKLKGVSQSDLKPTDIGDDGYGTFTI